jgi:CubicO group peptidase (beta-lactamase class C family)
MNAQVLTEIDTLAQEMIRQHMAPGCQILVARHGKVVFNKNYGHHTYDTTSSPVSAQTRYDLASVTKVAGTLQVIMKLYGEGKLDLDAPLINYLPELANTNKADILVRHLLEHRAGLQPFIPFWKRTMINGQLSFKWYCDRPEDGYTSQIASQVYAMETIKDSIWTWIIKSDLVAKNKDGAFDAKYSDLSFLFLQRIAERIVGKNIDLYLTDQFYKKLGIGLVYKPRLSLSADLIAPTELDSIWRHGLVLGTVHDQTAALLGGVAGHAGLFGTANDLAVLLQMNLQDGYYGGKRYLNPGIVSEFTRRVPNTTRGTGWDKPPVDRRDKVPVSQYVTSETYGHTGFTGNCVWVDPVYDLVFVFLSNRVYPDANNLKLSRSAMRGRIHDVVYESIRHNFPDIAPPEEASLIIAPKQ